MYGKLIVKTLIIGSNGKIGKQLVKKLVESGHSVRAMVRNESQRSALEKMGAEVTIGDLEGQFFHALDGCDALVFSAGSGGHTGADKTILVDMWGAIKTISACEEKKLQRFIMISSRNAGDPENGPDAIKHYNVCKHIADEYLLKSSLDYTILRPGKLTDSPGNGLVRTSRSRSGEQSVPRADVVTAIKFCLENDDTIGKVIELYQGNKPIAAALSSAD